MRGCESLGDHGSWVAMLSVPVNKGNGQGKEISPKYFLHFPTMTWWERGLPADAPAEALRRNDDEVGQTQFVFCGRECEKGVDGDAHMPPLRSKRH